MFRTAFALAVIGTLASNGARAADMESALLDRAKGLVKHCKEKGYKNVGVLKFLAAKEGNDLSDNLGTVNTLVGQRLEIALLLTNDPRMPVGLIEDASAVAAKTIGANHRTPEGRKALLGAKYKLAWGDPKVGVTADTFFTGLVGVSKDLKTLTISFLYFDRTTNKLEPVPGVSDAVVTNRAAALVELGESFSVRGAFDDGKVESKTKEKDGTPTDLPKDKDKEPSQTAIKAAADVREKASPHPAEDPNAPVKLTVFYNGKRVKVEVKDGKAFLPEPATGQNVEFVITKDGSNRRLGVVLKVNGENTLDKQRLPDATCRMWVLTKPGEAGTIRGYHLGTDRLETFRVLSAPESKAREVNYGPDVGTVTLTVFPEGKEAAPVLTEDAAEKKAVEAVKLPAEPSKSFDSLKAKLLEDANRGLIGEGAQVEGKVQVVKFVPSANPVMTLTVVYYKAK